MIKKKESKKVEKVAKKDKVVLVKQETIEEKGEKKIKLTYSDDSVRIYGL